MSDFFFICENMKYTPIWSKDWCSFRKKALPWNCFFGKISIFIMYSHAKKSMSSSGELVEDTGYWWLLASRSPHSNFFSEGEWFLLFIFSTLLSLTLGWVCVVGGVARCVRIIRLPLIRLYGVKVNSQVHIVGAVYSTRIQKPLRANSISL